MTKILTIPTNKYLDNKGEPLRSIIQNNFKFVERAEAEVDDTYLQIIPYIIVHDKDRIFTYTRLKKGNEARLHNKVSIGIGGHIDMNDDILNPLELMDSSMYQELYEELNIELNNKFLPINPTAHVIYDPSNPVGKVHLGIMCTCDVSGRTVTVAETDKLEGGFRTHLQLAELYIQDKDNFETWSQIALKNLGIV